MYPLQSNEVNYTYQITQTTFGNNTYPMNAASLSVYKNNVLQTITTHYTVDANNGSFTMVSNPGSNEIRCFSWGLECDWISGGYNNSQCPSQFLKFMLVDVNGISKEDINWASFLRLATSRGNYAVTGYFDQQVGTYEILSAIKRHAQVFIYTKPNGEICADALSSTVPSNAQRFYTEDFLEPITINEDTDQCYSRIIGKAGFEEYPKDTEIWYDYPANATWPDTENRATWQHGVSRTLDLGNMWTYKAYELPGMRTRYLNILKKPLTTITTTLPARALLLNPLDKIYISYSIKDADGTTVSLYSSQVFVIMEIEKDVNTATARIKAVKSFDDLYWTDMPT